MKYFQEIKPDATKQELYDIKYTTKDFNGQFTETRQRKPEELYANLMYLSNQLAHVFGEEEKATVYNNVPYSKQMAFIKDSLMDIKNWCVHKLIEEKENGANVEVAIEDKNSKDKYGMVFTVSLPNYFEPFIVHIPQDLLSKEEKQACIVKGSFLWDNKLKTTFPTYVREEKAKLLEQLYYDKYYKDGTNYRNSKDRLRLFLNRRNRILGRKAISGAKTIGAMKSDADKINIQRDNIIVFEELERILNMKFPNYFRDGFLHRTSYSLRDVQNAMDATARSELKKLGISEENIDTEMAKLFIYMKVTEPLSTLSRDAEKRDETVRQDVERYINGFNFIKSNLRSTKKYSELKSKTKGLARQNEEKGKLVIPGETTNVELIREVSDLKDEVARLTAELEAMKMQYSETKGVLNKVKKKNQKLIMDNSKLKKRNKRLERMLGASGGGPNEQREDDENEK